MLGRIALCPLNCHSAHFCLPVKLLGTFFGLFTGLAPILPRLMFEIFHHHLGQAIEQSEQTPAQC